MKRLLLLVPLVLLLVSCQSKEEKYREVCARWHSGQYGFNDQARGTAMPQLELRDNGSSQLDEVDKFCEYYR